MAQSIKDIEKLTKKNNCSVFDWRYNWHYIMLNYGYISKKEFLDMDFEDIIFLMEVLKEHNNIGFKK